MADVKTEQALQKAQEDTVQVLPDASKGEGNTRIFLRHTRGPLLPELGSYTREQALRKLYWFDYNWAVKSAFTGLMKKVAATPWEIQGPEDVSEDQKSYFRKQLNGNGNVERPDIVYYQQLLRQANFGAGWANFIKMGVDYLRQDAGWYWEIIAPGEPNKPPTGPTSGIAYLDSLRCIPTGDPDFPVIYYNENNKYHLLHHTRVVHMVDMPEGDVTKRGYGLCALSRAVVIANREIGIARYIDMFLDEKPPPGIVVASGMTRQERDMAMSAYMSEQRRDEQQFWGKQLWFYAADVTQQAGLTFQSFSQAPEKFDFKTYTEIDIDSIALALGVDRQELWQLTGGNLGSGSQSQILNQKSRGKALADLFSNIERAVNDVLPEDYTFEFKFRDADEDMETANTAQVWANVASIAGSNMSKDEVRRLLANQVDGIKDAISDESGQIVSADDIDVQREPPPARFVTVEPATPDEETEEEPEKKQLKDYAETSEEFKTKLAGFIFNALRDKDIARFGIATRRLLRQSGEKGYLDGLEVGGIVQETLDADEKAVLVSWIAAQSPYVTDIGKRIKAGENVNPEASAEMWANKSLREIYHTGMLSADRNGLYKFVLGATEKHCKTCLRLNGQVHRLKDWIRKNLFPGSSELECGGWRCDCRLEKTTGRASGNW